MGTYDYWHVHVHGMLRTFAKLSSVKYTTLFFLFHYYFYFMYYSSSSTTVPTITVPTPLSSTSFIVNWTITDPDHNYIVTWTNLHTGMMSNVTVPENTSSYMVTGLNGIDNYNVSVTANNNS